MSRWSLPSFIENRTLPCLYEAPLMLEKAGFSDVVCRRLGLRCPAPEMVEWAAMVEKIKSAGKSVTIGLVGKYTQLQDAYLSVAEALRHAGYAKDTHVEILWIDSETLTAENAAEKLTRNADAGERHGKADGSVRHPRSRRLRGPGRGGDDPRRAVCTGARGSLPWHLPWDAGGGDRVCPPCCRDR